MQARQLQGVQREGTEKGQKGGNMDSRFLAGHRFFFRRTWRLAAYHHTDFIVRPPRAQHQYKCLVTARPLQLTPSLDLCSCYVFLPRALPMEREDSKTSRVWALKRGLRKMLLWASPYTDLKSSSQRPVSPEPRAH